MADVETREAEEATALQALGSALTRRGFEVKLSDPGGHVPALAVRNPQHIRLDETVIAGEGSFIWSWGEKIGAVADVEAAAVIVARVLSAGASST
jgi:hypothetical protein